ncbi:hypothetical protein KC19_10G161000 [Ceratodon purpureus]|uniref:NPH3 domain-containing protein n=1 Tax=Ceratodon purpureus TaxID=3225 RepID=A0A8T0GT93_CERPU|nr:hypothetical protein KC19_10G161000 [Ceratodon purpureus]
MSPWLGGGDSKLSSFSKRRWKNRSSLPDMHSPTTVLSPRDSSESSSITSSDEQHVNRIINHLVNGGTVKNRETEVEARLSACFEPINSKTWTVTTDKPSDLLVEVNDISFHLHKLPILSRSALLSRLVAKFCDSETACINLGSVPGGADAFALAAKFCYGIDVELTPANVAGLRCVSEYLEMTENLEEGNVSSKAEAYLNSVVLNSWNESIAVLATCEHLLPWAEDLHIIQRCSQSIARKACTDPRNVRWTAPMPKLNSPAVKVCSANPGENWWYEEVSCLTLHCFEKVTTAMVQNLMNPILIGGALELYARKWLPGVFKVSEANTPKASSPSSPSSRIYSPAHTGNASPVHEFAVTAEETARLHEVIVEQNKNRFTIEKIVTLVPQQKDTVSSNFLLRMLRAANMFSCSPECRAELEKKAGQQLDQATLSDLLIPSFCHTSEYLYDVDLVSRLLDHFIALEQGLGGGLKNKFFNKRIFGSLFVGGASAAKQAQAQPSARSKIVAKLMDSYLAEVARDIQLPLAKFQSLAEAVPVTSRVSDDGLYRAIDTYLKIHPGLTEMEKKKLCRILDSQRFSVAACMHAAQNERLPLRIVVQVLFGEQLKLRDAITGISQSIQEDRAIGDSGGPLRKLPMRDESPDSSASQQAMLETTNQMEIRALQQELSTMRIKYTELEKSHSTMMEMVEKLSRPRRNSTSSWTTPWKKAPKYPETPRKEANDSSNSGRSRTNNASAAQRWRNSIS